MKFRPALRCPVCRRRPPIRLTLEAVARAQEAPDREEWGSWRCGCGHVVKIRQAELQEAEPE